VSRRPREIIVVSGHAHLCVCVSVRLSAVACPHYCTDPDVTWGSSRGCPLVVHYWADLQSMHARVALLWQHYGNAWQSPVVIRQAHRTLHACRTRTCTLCMPAKTRLADDNIDAPAACAFPFRPYCGGVVTRTRNVSEYMLVLTLCLVVFSIYAHSLGHESGLVLQKRRRLSPPKVYCPFWHPTNGVTEHWRNVFILHMIWNWKCSNTVKRMSYIIWLSPVVRIL